MSSTATEADRRRQLAESRDDLGDGFRGVYPGDLDPEGAVARTPNGRYVMRRGGSLEVQPHNDNYWIAVADLAAAKQAYHGTVAE